MEILVVAAHPDDEVLGLGGTLCKLSSEGHCIHLLVVTDGSSKQYEGREDLERILDEKAKQTILCSKILGIKTIDYGGFPDMMLDTISHTQINECISSIIEKYHIEVVFTHFYGDLNKDHKCVFESTLVSVRPLANQSVKHVLLYKTPSSTEWNISNTNNVFLPNVFVDITRFEEQKLKALQQYGKELRPFPHPRSLEAIKQYDSACGISVGCEFADRKSVV